MCSSQMTIPSYNSFWFFRHLFLVTLIAFGLSCSAGSVVPRSDHERVFRPDAININSANAVELQRLPGIGPKTAQKILAYRSEFGDFKRPAEIILVDGFGERQYLKIRDLIKTE